MKKYLKYILVWKNKNKPNNFKVNRNFIIKKIKKLKILL